MPGNPGQSQRDDLDNSPQAIADWLRWYDSLQPLTMTEDEEADSEAWLKKMSEQGTAETETRIQDLFR